MWGYGLDQAGSIFRLEEGTCEYGNEFLGAIKLGKFFD
jgi:hypothetical protein